LVFTLLVIAAWGSLFIPLPRWLVVSTGVAFLGLGGIFLLFGLMGSYWDSHMTPGHSPSTPMLLTGVLLLLSQAVRLVRFMASASPRE
jgi:hypothetical protein